ncbi:MAG: hypothetical protein HUK21_03110 [Fibrobacteraceae bacterium]|nr:hypothetical protein [Fibrobacteraceae bacterium]
MSRSERRRGKQNAKHFVPKKTNAMSKWVIAVIATVAALFWIGTTLIQRGA